MIPKPCGIRIAANRPCTSRAAISVPVVGARPHRTEEAVKPVTPSRNRRRRPKMSPSRAPVMRPMANVSA
jgi:hypothetical protein